MKGNPVCVSSPIDMDVGWHRQSKQADIEKKLTDREEKKKIKRTGKPLQEVLQMK